MKIMTVYKPEETIDLLEEWLDYHTKLGVDEFILYDNGGGIDNSSKHNDKTILKLFKIDNTKHSKSGISYSITTEEARERQQKIFERYNVTHKIWNPTDERGNIVYNQMDAISNFRELYKSGLCAFIDIDEFIVKKEEFRPSRLTMHQYKHFSYYNSIYDCHERVKFNLLDKGGSKVILDLATSPLTNSPHGTDLNLPFSESHINHYNFTPIRYKFFLRREQELGKKLYYLDRMVSDFKTFADCFVYQENTGLQE